MEDVSGTVVDVSETPVDVSGEVVDVSETPVDVSETPVDVSETPVDVSGELVDVSGEVLPSVQPTPLPPIRLEDILSSMEVLRVKEASDKSSLEAIETISYDILRPRLIQWATSGFRNAYPIYEIYMTAPPLCSDGESRNLYDYIQFVSGKTIGDHVAGLQARLPDMTVSFAYSGYSILIVVSKV